MNLNSWHAAAANYGCECDGRAFIIIIISEVLFNLLFVNFSYLFLEMLPVAIIYMLCTM